MPPEIRQFTMIVKARGGDLDAFHRDVETLGAIAAGGIRLTRVEIGRTTASLRGEIPAGSQASEGALVAHVEDLLAAEGIGLDLLVQFGD
jgi:hypothetical protein